MLPVKFMKITALVENKSKGELKPMHGLSLYIETKKHRILFDLGPDETLFENAEKMKVDLTKVDTVIISHGHSDHGGALQKFLEVNHTAKIYVQKKAFEPHYCKVLFINANVGLNAALKENPQIVLVTGDLQIDEELKLFTVNHTEKCYSSANNMLQDKDGRDSFAHEQNLIICENEPVLVMGCGHAGVVNIMEAAKKYEPVVCVGGYHLFNPLTRRTVKPQLLDQIVGELDKYKNVRFYTCHCTGTKAYDYLCARMKEMHYLSCGESINI